MKRQSQGDIHALVQKKDTIEPKKRVSIYSPFCRFFFVPDCTMKSTTTSLLMILILYVSLSYSSMQTKTSTRHPNVQHTTIYSTTTIQSPTHKTSPRDILSNLNYPVQETTTTERRSTTPVKNNHE